MWLTGSRLSWLLAGGGLLAALALDITQGNLTAPLQSVTFPWLVSAALSAAAGVWGVPFLQRLKVEQAIREDGPQAHLRKAGTPTMGGIFFVPVGVAVALIEGWLSPAVSGSAFVALWAVSALTLSYGFIGWIDDWQVIRRRSNKGISPRTKLALQIAFAMLFCAWAKLNPDFVSATTIRLPGDWLLPLGTLFWLLAGFVLVAESNATNLTDGVDGLMAGTGTIAFLGLAALVTPAFPALALFCACMSGACLGFLAHNRNPARVFMGDTGSLALGGALASVGILANVLFGLFVLSGLFFVETLSVIAQVGYYKATKNEAGVGKRLLKMAPLHHHFELSGYSELQVVSTFYGVTAVLAAIALLL
jgi:phospho-N-acetylmuramoyl-pentapeptide-transferase